MIPRPSSIRLLTCLSAHLSLLAPPICFSLSLFPSRGCFLSLIVALILCTWWSKSGNSSTRAFCQTDYGTSGISLAPSRPIIRPVSSLSSLVPLSLCLRVSVLIRHFVDTRIYARVYVCAQHAHICVRQDVRDTLI